MQSYFIHTHCADTYTERNKRGAQKQSTIPFHTCHRQHKTLKTLHTQILEQVLMSNSAIKILHTSTDKQF